MTFSVAGVENLLNLDFLTAQGIKLIEDEAKETFRSFLQRFDLPRSASGTVDKLQFSDLFWFLNQVRINQVPVFASALQSSVKPASI